jgi:Ca-activated chloride channel family protein
MNRRIAVTALLLWIATNVWAAAEPLPLTKMGDVKSGTMLLKTTQPGVYAVAPTVKTDIQLHVRGIVLRGDVTQTFTNPEPSCAEAVYVFPLPENAAVDTLKMTIGQHVIDGEIQERKQAVATYEQAKAAGQHATLLTEERPNLFTAAIANIGSGETVVVQISYQQTIDYRDGAFSLRFPLAVGPRYLPADGNVTDGDRVTPPVAIGTARSKASIRVDLDAGVSLRSVESAHHRVTTTAISGSRYAVTLADSEVPADRDFELSWHPDLGGEPKTAMFAEGDYALMMILPPAQQAGARLPKESIFVVDTSGSMQGTSIEAAKRALGLALNRLQSGDRFNVIEFNSTTTTLFDDAQPATSDNIAHAKEWVGRLAANGGTRILDALQHALADAHPDDSLVRQIVFMTDGDSGNESQCFDYIRAHLGRSRLFTVGIGAAPNTHFMRDAARFGRGTFTYVASVNEVQEKMTTLFAKLESPVMTNVVLRFDDPAAEMWPQRVPDLYAGEPVVVAVKFANRSGRVLASGSAGSLAWNETMSAKGDGDAPGIAKLWAHQKIEALTDQGNADAQIVQLALEHHLVTPLTALVAVDHTPAAANAPVCETRRVPVNLPAGWGGIGEGTLPQTATPAPLLMVLGSVLLALALLVRR